MNKLFTAALGLSVAVLPVLGVGVATAEEPANCADAVTVLASADAAHKAAVEADENLADAIEADQALKDAKAELRDVQKKLDAATFEWKQVDDGNITDRPPASAPELRAAWDAAKKKVRDLQDDVEDAKDAVKDAKEAAEDKVRDLRAKANETDAAALQVELDAARADFNRLCTEGEDDPTDNADNGSSDTSDDNDSESVSDSGSDVVVTPAGGVNTGGWRK